MSRENIIVGLDIGTTKIGCIIAELDPDRNVKIVGVGTSRSEGLRRGVVVNLEKTVVSIGRADRGGRAHGRRRGAERLCRDRRATTSARSTATG